MLSPRLSKSDIERIDNTGVQYHPDLILYDLSQQEYQQIWQKISNHPKDRLYADGIQVKPLGWFGAFVQKAKGWFGFDNHCQTNKVEMTLAKLAYYGYLKGYNNDAIHYPNSLITHIILKSLRTNKNSASLQTLLMSYYKRHISVFPQSFYPISEGSVFGETLLNLNLPDHIPALDPQNMYVIKRTMHRLLHSEETPEHIPESLFTQTYTAYLIENQCYAEALKWSPNIYKQYRARFIQYYHKHDDATLRPKATDIIMELVHSANADERQQGFCYLAEYYSTAEQLAILAPHPELRTVFIQPNREHFIEFYLQQDTDDATAKAKALVLIVELAKSPDAKQQERALNYLTTYFPYAEQLHYLQGHPEIKKKLALQYIEQALQVKNQFLITKLIKALISTASPLAYITHAVNLDSNVWADLPAAYIPLIEEWNQHLFNEAMSYKRFTEADTLFEENPFIKFNPAKLAELRTYYQQQIALTEQGIKVALDEKNVEKAEQLALDAIALAKKIARITPTEHPIIRATLGHTATMVSIDEIKNPNVADADLTLLNKMLSVLNQHATMNPSAELTRTRNRLLQRKIDYFIEQVKVPVGTGNSWKLRTEFADNHMNELNELQTLLRMYITLHEKDNTKEVSHKVATMHYILGDLLEFFLDNKNDAISHFAAAAKIKHKNPYYQDRHLKLIGDSDKAEKAREAIAGISPSSETDYNNWLAERWDAGEKTISKGVEIHNVEVEKKGFFSFLYLG